MANDGLTRNDCMTVSTTSVVVVVVVVVVVEEDSFTCSLSRLVGI